MRFLLAHSYGSDDDGLEAWREAVRQALWALAPGDGQPTLTLGVEDYREWFSVCGSWNAWLQRWAMEMGPDGRPTYDGIVLRDVSGIKRYTGMGIEFALSHGRPVYWFDERGNGTFYTVKSIEQVDGTTRWPIYRAGL